MSFLLLSLPSKQNSRKTILVLNPLFVKRVDVGFATDFDSRNKIFEWKFAGLLIQCL